MPPKPAQDKQDKCADKVVFCHNNAEHDFPLTKQLWPDSAAILERSRGVLFSLWEELLRFRRISIKTSDPEDIHDLRVASRRFRAALELFYPFAPKGARSELRKSIRKLTQILGGLRNIDEALLFFQSKAQKGISADIKLGKALAGQRVKELKRIDKALRDFGHRKFDKMVRAIVAGLNEESITGRNSLSLLAYFSDVSIRLYMPIHRLLAISTRPGHSAPRHALRIAIKKWRYFFEIMVQILGRDYSTHLSLLREYQSILGRMNDIAEFRLLLRKLDLPKSELEYAETSFLTEEISLLESFSELTGLKPLNYIFLI